MPVLTRSASKILSTTNRWDDEFEFHLSVARTLLGRFPKEMTKKERNLELSFKYQIGIASQCVKMARANLKAIQSNKEIPYCCEEDDRTIAQILYCYNTYRHWTISLGASNLEMGEYFKSGTMPVFYHEYAPIA